MISDVDEALRNLILDSLTVSRQNVDIKYDLPSRDWASRLNRPTINLFLFDIRENLRLRGMTARLKSAAIRCALICVTCSLHGQRIRKMSTCCFRIPC